MYWLHDLPTFRGGGSVSARLNFTSHEFAHCVIFPRSEFKV